MSAAGFRIVIGGQLRPGPGRPVVAQQPLLQSDFEAPESTISPGRYDDTTRHEIGHYSPPKAPCTAVIKTRSEESRP